MTPLTEYPFPEYIDSTAITKFRSCPRMFFYENILRIVPKGISLHLTAGGAFARGLEVARRAYWESKLSTEDAMALGFVALTKEYGNPPLREEDIKTWDRVATAFESYLDRFPLDKDPVNMAFFGGKPAVEFTFCIPIEILHPTTGRPLCITGRCDWIGEFQNLYMCLDEKTASRFDRNWADSWELRSQLMTYTWAAQQHGLPVKGAIVRGTAIQKNDIKHAESIVYHTPWKLQRWYTQLIHDLNRMIQCWRTGYWDYDLGESCVTKYGPCDFTKLCQAQNPTPWIPILYRPNEWNPLTRNSPFLVLNNQEAANVASKTDLHA